MQNSLVDQCEDCQGSELNIFCSKLLSDYNIIIFIVIYIYFNLSFIDIQPFKIWPADLTLSADPILLIFWSADLILNSQPDPI